MSMIQWGRTLADILSKSAFLEAERRDDEVVFLLESEGAQLGLSCRTGCVDLLMPVRRLEFDPDGKFAVFEGLSAEVFLHAGGWEHCLLKAEETTLDAEGMRPWLDGAAAFFSGSACGVEQGTLSAYRRVLRLLCKETGTWLPSIAFCATPLSRSYVGEPLDCMPEDHERARAAAASAMARFRPYGWIFEEGDGPWSVRPMDADDMVRAPAGEEDDPSAHERLEAEAVAAEILESL